MTTIIVDTSILIDHLRGDERARDALGAAVESGHGLVASVLTRVEVLAGMRPAEEGATRQLLGALEWVEVDQDPGDRAGLLAQTYLRSHPGVDPVDHVIAARAKRLAAQLWTLNLRHFPMIPDLRPPY